MWNGVACCAGHGTGSDKGCFLCEPVTACKKETPAGGGAAAVLRVKVGPFGGAVERLERRQNELPPEAKPGTSHQ